VRPGAERETFAPDPLRRARSTSLGRGSNRAATTRSAPGLSSSIFTLNDLREAELFVSATKARIAASPTSISARRAPRSAARSAARRRRAAAARPARTAWKAYMRRATNTLNYGTTLPLAQGVSFDVDA
jgi:aldehyde dehydrogenase (NAD+)